MSSKDPLAAKEALSGDIRRMIDETRASVAVSVNAALTLLYWRIGQRASVRIFLKRGELNTGPRLSRRCHDN